MGSDTQGVQLCDPIEVTAPITQAREPGGLAAIQPSQPSQLIEGHGAQAMVLDVVEESAEFFGRRLFADGRVLGAVVLRGQEGAEVKLNAWITDMLSGLLGRRRGTAEGAVRAAGDFAD